MPNTYIPLYQRITWEGFKTPLNASNLNNIENRIDCISDYLLTAQNSGMVIGKGTVIGDTERELSGNTYLSIQDSDIDIAKFNAADITLFTDGTGSSLVTVHMGTSDEDLSKITINTSVAMTKAELTDSLKIGETELDENKLQTIINGDDRYLTKPEPYTYSIVPCIKNNGQQDRYVVSSVSMGGAIPMYSNGGVLKVIDPISEDDCVNKRYAEANFMAKHKFNSSYVTVGALDEAGNSKVIPIAFGTPREKYLAGFDTGGVLKTNTPDDAKDNYCVNKKYAEDHFLKIPDYSKGNVIPYVEYITGEQKSYYVSASGYRGYVAVCASNSKGEGVLNTNTPENDLHAANKKYVDDAISSLGWKCIAENVYVYPSTFSIQQYADGRLLMFVIREPDGIKTAYFEGRHGSDNYVYSSPFKMYNQPGLAYIRGYDGDYELLDAITDEPRTVYDDMYITAYTI